MPAGAFAECRVLTMNLPLDGARVNGKTVPAPDIPVRLDEGDQRPVRPPPPRGLNGRFVSVGRYRWTRRWRLAV